MVENLIPIPVYILVQQPHKTGDYLKTLNDWGELPEVVTVPNVARLLAALCKQNPSAIVKVLEGAIETNQITYWSWVATANGGEWEQDTETVDAATGRLHLGSIGIRPADAVGLLVKRGRRVPPELLELLPAPATDTATPERVSECPAPTQTNGAAKRWTATLLLEVEAYRANHTEQETATHFGVSGPLIRRKLAAHRAEKLPTPFAGLGKR